MNNTDALPKLFSRVAAIKREYEDRALKTGENFNLFSIMGMETSEDWTHSAIIAEFLNSDGSHGQGDKFMRIFLEIVNPYLLQLNEQIIAFARYSVQPKKRIGKINEAFSEGGEIDIYIEDSSTCLIVENKIYARDQRNQLLRYHNYGKTRRRKVWLFYLTLDGRRPQEGEGLDMEIKKRIIPISYKTDILAWLQLCKTEVAHLPLIQESLTQYIYLVKKLTNQSTNKEMENEIIKTIISDRDSLSSAFAIGNIMKDKFAKVDDSLLIVLKQQLQEKAGKLGLETRDAAWGTSTRPQGEDSYFCFTWPGSEQGLYLAFAFDDFNCVDFSIGVYSEKQELRAGTDAFKRLQLELANRLEAIGRRDPGTQDNYLYVCYEPEDDSLTRWWGTDIWLDIPDGRTADKLIALVQTVYENIKDIDFEVIMH